MKIYETMRKHPLMLVLAAVATALLLLAALSLSLSPRAEAMADPQVTKQVNTDQAAPGDILTYTIYIKNNTGQNIFTASLVDALPAEVSYVSGSLVKLGAGDVEYAAGVVTWTCDSFWLGSEATITFTVEISDAIPFATIVNTAEFTGTGSLITSTVSTDVSPANLDALKTIDSPVVHPDGQVVYTIYISNTGNGAADPVSMTDSLPPEVSYAGGLDATGGTGASWGEAGGIITWTGRLDPSDKVTITFMADVSSTLSEGTYFTNTAYVSGAGLFESASVGALVVEDFAAYLPMVYKDCPPKITLNPILVQGLAYTVSWESVSTADYYYVLQESLTPDFATVTEWQTTDTTQEFTKTIKRAYYYRVRLVCPCGVGDWSDVQAAIVGIDYYDTFDNPGSGWTTHSAACCLSGCDGARNNLNYKYSLFYGGGRFHVNIPNDCRGGGNHGDTRHIYPVSFAPGIQRPDSKTCLQVQGSFENWDPWWSFWGLVFASSEDMRTFYSLEVNNRGDWAVVKRENYPYPGPNHPFENEDRTYLVSYIDNHRYPANTAFNPNVLMAEITGKDVRLFINGIEVHYFEETEVRSLKYVGFFGGDWEVAPTQIGYDYFFLDEGCDTY